MGAVYFVVLRRSGRESPALYYDDLPDGFVDTRAAAHGVVYAVRLDLLPDPAGWLVMPLDRLYATYRELAAKGALPVQDLAPRKAPQEPARPRFGERMNVTPSWPRQPPDPFPAPEDVRLRPDAPAFIGPRVLICDCSKW